jgi:hypothetical protein
VDRWDPVIAWRNGSVPEVLAGQMLPGSDFAGGALALTAQNEPGEPDEKRAA